MYENILFSSFLFFSVLQLQCLVELVLFSPPYFTAIWQKKEKNIIQCMIQHQQQQTIKTNYLFCKFLFIFCISILNNSKFPSLSFAPILFHSFISNPSTLHSRYSFVFRGISFCQRNCVLRILYYVCTVYKSRCVFAWIIVLAAVITTAIVKTQNKKY